MEYKGENLGALDEQLMAPSNGEVERGKEQEQA